LGGSLKLSAKIAAIRTEKKQQKKKKKKKKKLRQKKLDKKPLLPLLKQTPLSFSPQHTQKASPEGAPKAPKKKTKKGPTEKGFIKTAPGARVHIPPPTSPNKK